MTEMLGRIEGRSKVSLRVHIEERRAAADAMALPVTSLAVTGRDPAMLWLGPNQWLLVSNVYSARALIDDAASQLAECPHIAIDISASLCCYRFVHEAAGRVLGAACGFDMESLDRGQCVRTRFGKISIIALSRSRDDYDLYVDVTQTSYFESLLRHEAAGRDAPGGCVDRRCRQLVAGCPCG